MVGVRRLRLPGESLSTYCTLASAACAHSFATVR